MKRNSTFFTKSLVLMILEIIVMKIVPNHYKIDSYLYIYFIASNLNVDFVKNIFKILMLGIIYDMLKNDICNHSFAVINVLMFCYFLFLKKGDKNISEDFTNNYEIMKSSIVEKFGFQLKLCLVYSLSLVFLKIVDSGVGFVNLKRELLCFLVNIALFNSFSVFHYLYSRFIGIK